MSFHGFSSCKDAEAKRLNSVLFFTEGCNVEWKMISLFSIEQRIISYFFILCVELCNNSALVDLSKSIWIYEHVQIIRCCIPLLFLLSCLEWNWNLRRLHASWHCVFSCLSFIRLFSHLCFMYWGSDKVREQSIQRDVNSAPTILLFSIWHCYMMNIWMFSRWCLEWFLGMPIWEWTRNLPHVNYIMLFFLQSSLTLCSLRIFYNLSGLVLINQSFF